MIDRSIDGAALSVDGANSSIARDSDTAICAESQTALKTSTTESSNSNKSSKAIDVLCWHQSATLPFTPIGVTVLYFNVLFVSDLSLKFHVYST